MLYFYKVLRSDGTLLCLLTYDNNRPNITDPLVVEITEEEYNVLVTEIEKKAAMTDQLYMNEITVDDVPMEWREEIQRRVDELIAEQGDVEEQEISAEEALGIILGMKGD